MSGHFMLTSLILPLFVLIVGAAIVNDIASLKIQNRFCISLVILYPAYVLTAASPVDWLGALAVAGIVFVVGTVLFSLRLVGGGDVKLIAALSLWAGPTTVLPFLLLTTAVGAAVAVLMLTPSRFAFAAVLEAVGADRLRERLLGPSIPYAIPIAAGAAATIGPVLIGAAP